MEVTFLRAENIVTSLFNAYYKYYLSNHLLFTVKNSFAQINRERFRLKESETKGRVVV